MDLTMIVKCGKYHILFLGSLLKFSHTAAGPKFVKKITFKLGVDFRLEMWYPYIVKGGNRNENICNTEKGR